MMPDASPVAHGTAYADGGKATAKYTPTLCHRSKNHRPCVDTPAPLTIMQAMANLTAHLHIQGQQQNPLLLLYAWPCWGRSSHQQ
jgi:hypothetical protein